MKTIEAIYCIPDNEPIVQLFLPDGGQWGEIRHRSGRLEIEMFAPQDNPMWVVDADQLVRVIGLAKEKLIDGTSLNGPIDTIKTG